MRIMFQGINQAIEEERKRNEKRRADLITLKSGALQSYLDNKNNQTSNSALVAAKLKNISKFLPEGSPIISKLAGVDAKTITALEKEVIETHNFYEENNLTYTPEMFESDLDVVKVEFENNPNLNLADIYKGMFKLTEEDLDDTTGGLTLREMLNTPQTSDIGISYSIKKAPKPIDAGEASSFNKILPDLLAPVLASERTQVDDQITATEGSVPVDVQERSDILEQATKALENKDYTKAIQIAGPEIAIKLMESSPQYKNLNFMINRGLIFPETNQGDELVARAIRSGLLQLGDTYQIGNDMLRVNQNQINLIFGG